MKTTPIKVRKGEIICDRKEAVIMARYKNFAVLIVDLKSKYAQVCGSSVDKSCAVILEATKDTIFTDIEMNGCLTEIGFPEFVGWRVFAAEVSKYTMKVCLMKG